MYVCSGEVFGVCSIVNLCARSCSPQRRVWDAEAHSETGNDSLCIETLLVCGRETAYCRRVSYAHLLSGSFAIYTLPSLCWYGC